MGRYRLNYSLYPRKTSSGIAYWYYRTYGPDGKRTSGKSTGCTSRTKARLYCENLLKEGTLYAGANKTLASYTRNMFEEGSPWYKEVYVENKLSVSYIKGLRVNYSKWILPCMGSAKLSSITKSDIDMFKRKLSENLSRSSANIVLAAFRIVLKWCVRQEWCSDNILKYITPFKAENTTHDSLSKSELQEMLSSEWKRVEDRNATIIAALTGMRKSEILGLDLSEMKDGYIDLKHQKLNGKLSELKTKEARKIPICKNLELLVRGMLNEDGLEKVNRAGINETVKSKCRNFENFDSRSITFHSLRHTFNTMALSYGISETKVASVMGHSAGVSSMQARYTNFKIEDYKEVVEFQESLWKELRLPQAASGSESQETTEK